MNLLLLCCLVVLAIATAPIDRVEIRSRYDQSIHADEAARYAYDERWKQNAEQQSRVQFAMRKNAEREASLAASRVRIAEDNLLGRTRGMSLPGGLQSGAVTEKEAKKIRRKKFGSQAELNSFVQDMRSKPKRRW